MKISKQYRVAKHALAIWMTPGDKESLAESLEWASRSWPNLSQRVLKTWVKELYRNPERYEYTGLAGKELKLEDFFSLDECDYVEMRIRQSTMVVDYDDIIRSICHFKWVYRMSVEDAIKYGIDTYYGKCNQRFYPVAPKLKPLEK